MIWTAVLTVKLCHSRYVSFVANTGGKERSEKPDFSPCCYGRAVVVGKEALGQLLVLVLVLVLVLDRC